MKRPLDPRAAGRRRLVAGALAGVAASIANRAHADDAYPSRPVRVIVPYAAGSSADGMARLFGERLSKSMKQPFVVENRAGAGGTIGVAAAVNAPADGYTLLLTTSSPLVINPALDRRTPYDPEKDLAPVALLGGSPLALVTAPSFPAASLDELIAHVRRNPGKLSYATSGPGSYSHVIMELFRHATGLELAHVPYKGPAQAEIDVMSGEVAMMFDSTATAASLIRSGRLRSFGISSKAPFALTPEIAPLAASGRPELREFDVSGWFAVLAPRATPATVVARLNAELNAALAAPDFQRQLEAKAVAAYPPGRPEDLGRLIGVELARWRKVGQAARIELQ